MLHINKYLFYNVCDKDIDLYNEIIDTIREEYTSTIHKLTNTQDCKQIRILIYKLISTVSFCIYTNDECIYLCRSILQIPKLTPDFGLYKYYINLLINLDKEKILGYNI